MFFRCYLLWAGLCLMITLPTAAQPEYPPPGDTASANKMLRAALQHLNTRNFDSAHALFQATFRISRQIRYDHGIVRSLNGLGNTSAELGNFRQSVYFLEHAIRFAAQMPDSGSILPLCYSNLGSTYSTWGDFEQGLRYYELAIATNERHPEAGLPLDGLCVNVGYLLNNAGRHNEALFYLQKGVPIAWRKGNFAMQALLYIHIGNAYMGKQVRDSAAIYFRLAISEAAITKSPYSIITRNNAYKGLGNLALKQNQPELAIYYLKQIAPQNNPSDLDAANEASLPLGLAYTKTGDLSLALFHLNNALEASRNTGLQQSSMEAHKILSDLYASRGDFEKAYDHQKNAWTLSDSIQDQKRSRAALQFESRIRSAIKDKELKEKQLIIELKEQEINTRNIWTGISIAGLIVAVAIIFLLNKNHKNKQALKDANTRQLLRQQQLHEFRSILQTEEKERNRIARDLHDGVMIQFSVVKMNLSALAGTPERLIGKEQLLPHIQQLNAATQALRNVAHHLMPDMLLEGGLAEALYYFCKSLQPDIPFQLRYEQMDEIPRFDLQIEIAIYRIVQELLQNIIKHAHPTRALVQISYNDHYLGIEVEDDGRGMDEQASRKGMGLKNIATRVKHLNGNMHLSSNSSGTSISLEFNLEQLEQIAPDAINETI